MLDVIVAIIIPGQLIHFPLKEGSDFLWHGVDENVVDGAVNGSAGLVAWLSGHIRKLETGFVQNYALAILLGVVLIAGYLIGR